MFDFTGFFSRDDHHDDAETMSVDTAAGNSPADFLVLKDGRPFAIVNATPGLAEYTIAGFALATPEAHWALARG